MWSPIGQPMAHACLQDVRTRVQVRAWRARATPEPERTRQPHLAPLPHPPPAATAAQLPLSGSDPCPRLPQQEAEVHPDLDLFRCGAVRRRLRLFAAALRQHPELEVVPQTRERHSGLLRRLVRAGAVGLARRDALVLVFLAALLAAHAEVAVDAAQRQAEAVHRLEPGLPSPHGEPVGEDSAL